MPVVLPADFTDPRLAAIYDAMNAYQPGTQPAFYTRLADDLNARRIVDIGCGTGLITELLATADRTVVGIEPSARLLAIARKRDSNQHVTWVEGDTSVLGSHQFDLALMTGHVAQFFLTDEDWHQALRSIHGA
ncbi:MAG: class I SAM-dependent methyltransferase, partial [Chloroflexota bacterium]